MYTWDNFIKLINMECFKENANKSVSYAAHKSQTKIKF